MASIPEYLSQVGASPSGLPMMQPARVSDDIAQASARLGASLNRASDAVQEYEHQKQIEWVNKTYSDASLQWYQTLDKRKEHSQEGAPDFVANFNKDFEAWQNSALGQARTPIARMALQDRLSALREHLNQQAMHFEGHARVSQFENNIDRFLQGVGPTSMPYAQQVEGLNAVVDSSSVYAGFRAAHGMQARQKLAANFGMQEIQRDPQGTLAQIKPSGGTLLMEPALDASPDSRPQWFRDLAPDKQAAMISHAEAQVHRGMSEARTSLTKTVNDHEGLFSVGRLPQVPLTLADFQKALPQDQAMSAFDSYQSRMATGVEANSLSVLPTADIQRIVTERANGVQSAPEGAVLDAKERARVTSEAAGIVLKMRSADPIAAAQSSQMFGIQPLNSADPVAFKQQLATRQAAALQIGRDWGVESGPFTKAEAESFSRAMSGGTAAAPVGVGDQMRLLQSLKDGISSPAVYRAAVGQIVDKGNPAAALAGYIVGQPYQVPGLPQQLVATRILQGLAVMRDAKESLPKINETELKRQFKDFFGDSLDSIPSAREAAYQAAIAYIYGSKLGQIPDDKKVGVDIAEEAFKAVAGQVVDVNGRKVAPVYGFPPELMAANLDAESKKALLAHGIQRDFTNLQFTLAGGDRSNSSGGGVYLVLNNLGESILSPKTGLPITVNLSDPATLLRNASVPNWFFFNKNVAPIERDPRTNAPVPGPVKAEQSQPPAAQFEPYVGGDFFIQ